jgi:hypothetical protein
MKPFEMLDRIVRPIAVPNLTMTLVVGQATMFVASFLVQQKVLNSSVIENLPLIWSRVFEGELWRLITWLFVPPPLGLLTIFYFLVFQMVGTAVEGIWGTVRYCAYLYLGALLTMIAGLIFPDAMLTGLFLETTVFLAFATYNPNYTFLIFFVLPVKVKYLAALSGLGYLFLILFGPIDAKLTSAAAIGNYLLFFTPMLIDHYRGARRRVKQQVQMVRAANLSRDVPRHVCKICGINNLTHPKTEFRYCSKCNGAHAYCEQHLREHEHVAS